MSFNFEEEVEHTRLEGRALDPLMQFESLIRET